MSDRIFAVYIMANYLRSTFYVGVTNNLHRRSVEHGDGIGSVFTTKYHLTDLVYYDVADDAYGAICREKELKGWRREKKMALIKTFNSLLRDLSQDILD